MASLPDLATVIHAGFLPRIHDRGLDPSEALTDYFATYVERDLRELAAVHDLQRFNRFVRLCAGRTGQFLNLSSLGSFMPLKSRLGRRSIQIIFADCEPLRSFFRMSCEAVV